MKSEFIAVDKAEEKVEWLQRILEDIPLWPKSVPAIRIHCDNQAAIFRTQNFVYNDKFRHINYRHNIIRQLLSNRFISIYFVTSNDNLADPSTKGLSKEHINCVSKKMWLKA